MKVGDKVVSFRSGYGGRVNGYAVYTIERETTRHFITTPGFSKWRKENGKLVSSDQWHASYIQEITPKVESEMAVVKEQVRKSRALDKLRSLKTDSVVVSADRLEEILAELQPTEVNNA